MEGRSLLAQRGPVLDTAHWKRTTECTQLAPMEAHVWLLELEQWTGTVADCRRVLSIEEEERATRFRDARHRERYQITRGALRLFVARYAGISGADVNFAYGAHGKPALAGEPQDSLLYFNVSHSGEFAVLAFTLAGEIGVDIEQVRRDMPRRDDIAERHFAPGERAQLNGLADEDRADAFFRCWTRKEAFLKARGDGIFGGLQTFEVDLDPGAPGVRSVDGDAAAAAKWSMADLPPVPGFWGAVAVAVRGCNFIFFHADPSVWRGCRSGI